MMRIAWLRRLALAAMLLAFCVVVFGAYVRLTNAGLGCPDWPGCYGHVTPAGGGAADAGTAEAPLHVGKAWREMIHRYGASTLGLLILAIAFLSLRWRRHLADVRGAAARAGRAGDLPGPAGHVDGDAAAEAADRHAHLVFGLATLSLLWWLWLTLRRRSTGPGPAACRAGRGGSAGALLRPAPQRVAARWRFRAGAAGRSRSCSAAGPAPTTPRWPARTFRNARPPGGRRPITADAFVLWRGLGINYEGGVLDHPARVAIHFTHRLGAIVATLALLVAAILTLLLRYDLTEPARCRCGAGGAACCSCASASSWCSRAFRCSLPRRTTPALRCCCCRRWR